MKVINTYIILGADMGMVTRRLYECEGINRQSVWYVEEFSHVGHRPLGLKAIFPSEARKLLEI